MIPWLELENNFAKHYCQNMDRPTEPISLMGKSGYIGLGRSHARLWFIYVARNNKKRRGINQAGDVCLKKTITSKTRLN